MCVYLNGHGSSIELLSCEQYIADNQQNEKNEDNKTQNEEKEKELEHDKDLALAISMSLNEENKRKQRETNQRELASEKSQIEETQSLKQLLNKIKQEKEEYVAANHRQRTRIITLERDIEILRNERDSTQIKITKLMEQNQTLKVKMHSLISTDFASIVHVVTFLFVFLQRINDELMEDQKENKMKMDELNEEIKQLKLSNINILEFESWNDKQIIMWMMNLEHGRFNKYNNILSKNLSEEDVKGIDLKTVDISDLKGWGVVNFGDRKALFAHIQQLINPNNNDNDNKIPIANEEGAESGGYFK